MFQLLSEDRDESKRRNALICKDESGSVRRDEELVSVNAKIFTALRILLHVGGDENEFQS